MKCIITTGDKNLISGPINQYQMILKQELSEIINSEEFKELKKEFPEIFLSSIFLDKTGWQFNFYYNNKLITFFKESDIIKTEESVI